MENKAESTKKPKLIKSQIWTIRLDTYDDNTSKLTRTNEGFNVLELLGILCKAKSEILDQLGGAIKPTITERNVITDSERGKDNG